MRQTINAIIFIDAFRNYGRYDQFGYEALQILFDYLESYEQDSGVELELDVIALCCDYSVDSWQDIATNYPIDLSECETDEDRLGTVLDFLNDNTQVCGTTEDGQVVYCSVF